MDDIRPTPPDDRTVKVPHLVMGLLFAGAVAVWALVATDAVGADEVAFLAPGVLVAAGVLGLLASVLSGRDRRRRRSGTPAQPVSDRGVEHDLRTDPDDARLDEPYDDLEHTAPLTPTQQHRDEESR